MDKKMNNEELQSRREFFKKAAKSALPILGAAILASAPGMANAAEEMGCSYGCSGSCSGSCNYSCRGNCYGGCKGGCQGSCNGSCMGSARGFRY